MHIRQESELGAVASVANAGRSRSAELAVFPALGGRAPHDAPKKGPRPPPASTPQPRPPAANKTQPQKVPLPKTRAFNIVSNSVYGGLCTCVFRQEVRLAAAAAAHNMDDHEGRSERPPAALLLLVLGRYPS